MVLEPEDCVQCLFAYRPDNTTFHVNWGMSPHNVDYVTSNIQIYLDGVDVTRHAFAFLEGPLGWVDEYISAWDEDRYLAQCRQHGASRRSLGYVTVEVKE